MAVYNKMQMNPLKKEWEETGVATLTELEAKTLNDNTKHTGIKYELKKKTNAKK